MLEKLRRARAIGKQPDAGGQLPLLKMGGSMEEFFESVRQETVNGLKLPNWYVIHAKRIMAIDRATGAGSCTSSFMCVLLRQ